MEPDRVDDEKNQESQASQAKSLLRSWEPKATSAIISGEATHYLFPQKYKRNIGEPIFIADEDALEALAVVKLDEPRAVHIGEVERAVESLGIDIEDVKKRWPSMSRFWLYPIDLIETFESGREFATSTVKGSWVDSPVFRQKAEEVPIVDGSEAGDGFGVSWDAQFIKRVEAKRLVTAVVLNPETTDAQGTIMSADVIEAAAHDFVIRLVAGKAKGIGYMHKVFGKDLFLVESFIAPEIMSIGGQVVPKGAWVMKVKVVDDEIWQKVLNGEIRGFSIGGKARVSRAI
jgi:hypothetical protein